MSKKFRPFITKFEELVKKEGYGGISDFVNKWITEGKNFQLLHKWLLLKDLEFERQTIYAALRPYLTVPYDAPSSFWNKWNAIAEAKGFDNIDDMMDVFKKKYTNTEIANELGVTTRTIEYLSIRMNGDRNTPMRELMKEKRPSHRDEDGFTKTDVKEKWNKILTEKGFKSLKEAAAYYMEKKLSPAAMAKELGVTERALRIRMEKAGVLISKENYAAKNTEDSLGLL
jgi:DNA-binding XRE family transcriptional regulator